MNISQHKKLVESLLFRAGVKLGVLR